MRKFGRRETNESKMKVKSRHGLLSVVIFDHQEVCTNAKPFISSMHNAAVSLATWSLKEENMAIRDACARMYELTCLTSTMIETFSEKYLEFGCTLRKLLAQEMDLNNLRKRVCQLGEKTKKLRKQNTEKEAKEREKGKEVGSKRLSLLEDLGNTELEYEEQKASVDARTTKHEILKGIHLQEAVSHLATGTKLLGKQLSIIGFAQDKLAIAIPVVPTQVANSEKYQGDKYFSDIVQEAADSLKLTRPTPFLEVGGNRGCHKGGQGPMEDQWVMVDLLNDIKPKNKQRLSQDVIELMKDRVSIANAEGRSYILNTNVAQRQLMDNHKLPLGLPDKKKRERPPVPPPRSNLSPPKPPLTPPPSSFHFATPEYEAPVDYPRVEPYAITRPYPNSQGLYARANLFDPTLKRLCRSWSGEDKWWTRDEDSDGYVKTDDPPSRCLSDEENEVVYAELEKDNENPSEKPTSYIDVLH